MYPLDSNSRQQFSKSTCCLFTHYCTTNGTDRILFTKGALTFLKCSILTNFLLKKKKSFHYGHNFHIFMAIELHMFSYVIQCLHITLKESFYLCPRSFLLPPSIYVQFFSHFRVGMSSSGRLKD